MAAACGGGFEETTDAPESGMAIVAEFLASNWRSFLCMYFFFFFSDTAWIFVSFGLDYYVLEHRCS